MVAHIGDHKIQNPLIHPKTLLTCICNFAIFFVHKTSSLENWLLCLTSLQVMLINLEYHILYQP